MSDAMDLFAGRSVREEGDVAYLYNDATAKRVSGANLTPPGNISIGRGINLENGIDAVEDDFLFRHRAGKIETGLQAYAWYTGAPALAQSVALDIGYNEGLGGLLHFPHMIAAFNVKDWTTASQQCQVADPRLDAQRYAPLRALLLSLATPAAPAT